MSISTSSTTSYKPRRKGLCADKKTPALGVLLLTCALLLTACSPHNQVTLNDLNSRANVTLDFELTYDKSSLVCTDGAMYFEHALARQTLTSFAFYLHDIMLSALHFEAPDKDNSNDKSDFIEVEHNVQLTQSNWQEQGIGLIVFDTICNHSPEPAIQTAKAGSNKALQATQALFNTRFVGTINSDAAKHIKSAATVKLNMKLGLPFSLNHLNPLQQNSPLNISSMFWSWRNGYKFMRLDLDNKHQGFSFHLGSAGCQSASSVRAPTNECDQANIVELSLPVAVNQTSQDINILVSIDIANLLTDTVLNQGNACMFMGIDQLDNCAGLLEALRSQSVFKQKANPS